jgi:predicted GH43/DUF377 family glycosyl hydrolase
MESLCILCGMNFSNKKIGTVVILTIFCLLPFFSLSAIALPLEPNANHLMRSTTRIHLKEFPNAFNPSLIEHGEGFLLIFRYLPYPHNQPWISNIGIVALNHLLSPVSKPQILKTRFQSSRIPSQSEDARVFSYRGRKFLIYNDNVDVVCPSYWDRRDLFIAELFCTQERTTLSAPLKLFCNEKLGQLWQKNWVPFEWNETLLLSYTLNPHEVLSPNLKNGECYSCYWTNPPIHWDFGTLRGSTPALLIDGEYLAFFHSGRVASSTASWGYDLWHYFMGAYTFSSTLPFEITKMTPLPIIANDFYTPSNKEKRVIMPGGFVVRGSLIYLAYGKDDCEMWIAVLDKEELKKSLIALKP